MSTKPHRFIVKLSDGRTFMAIDEPMTKKAAITAALAGYPSNKRPLVASVTTLDPILTF